MVKDTIQPLNQMLTSVDRLSKKVEDQNDSLKSLIKRVEKLIVTYSDLPKKKP